MHDMLKNEKWIKLLTGRTEDFIDETSCPRVPRPDLKRGVGSTAFAPKFTKW